ncbi:glycoside hydrolase family 3 N-terminal domain-containing protein [Streptacidiphilus melanogenes]|uniref:glycoside hydrolase family 3 N-terminal domain-containing protein n=1 Tax=Streptacidiphilus melanogenes TaxID=411235 RepID=UPI0005AA3947|nr:glycoside hydrolase family 3 N-terminal domain-containing protein [Streptacidiphilus melanogenes]
MRLHPSPTASASRGLPVRASAVTLGFAMLLSGCAAALSGPTARTSAAQPAADAVAATTCTNASRLATWSNQRLAMMTIAVPVSETTPSAVTAEVTAGAGAVLLFGSSAPSNLGSQLTTLRSHVPGHLGLLVMTDEEGGGIQRMANLVGSLPWPAYMGAHWTAAQIQANVAAVGKKMAAAGVNMDLAPVADVDGRNVAPGATDPDGWRSFSGNTGVAARDTVAYMNGLRSAGVIPVLKHFPGLGGASYNTDDGPAHTLTWATEKAVGLPPFTSAIAAGAPAVMMSNATVPGLATNPGGLSPTQITYELKGKLGFHGLVLTDSLTAKAVSAAGFSVPAAAVQALNSGADLVMFGLVSNVSSETNAIATAVTGAVAGGHLSRARLIDAAGQVLAVRHVNLC